MYKLLLCWRYLLTRYLALASIISVMLGVATLIVVNSVMAGFSTKLKERLHGLISDMVIESPNMEGIPEIQAKIERIRNDEFLGSKIEAMDPTLEVLALMQYRIQGETFTKYVKVVAVDPTQRSKIGGFAEHLLNPENRLHPSFNLTPEAQERYIYNHWEPPILQPSPPPHVPGEKPPPDPPPSVPFVPRGIILGNALASYRNPNATPVTPKEERDVYVLKPGDDIWIMTVSGQKLSPVVARFAVCDYFKSEMSEYDANYVFAPIDYVQQLRTMENRGTSIQIKLNDYRDAPEVKAKLKAMFPEPLYYVSTWEDKQGPLLGAIAVERGLLNVLLFLIICVAGFGILAIFAMIVSEKTRDIGILKALGASNGGVMKIFLGYGVLLGIVGAGLGTILGLVITWNINDIEIWLSKLTGHEVFPRDIYYFSTIPTDIQPMSVLLVNLGAVGIAVLASIFPAMRAAMLHPVRALRYE